MTLKEQIMKLQSYKMYEDEDTVYVERDDVLKALEQEPVLDKIRAEIEQAAIKDVNGSKYIFVNRINQIIDKYKADVETQESEGT